MAIVSYRITSIYLTDKILFAMSQDAMAWYDIAGSILVMGLLCGTFGINVGHELGHRVNLVERALAKALLLTSLYMHFFTEYNKGHHKRVATPEDPSSARYGESVYRLRIGDVAAFEFRSARNLW